MKAIPVNHFNQMPCIVFRNKSSASIQTWVFDDEEKMQKNLEILKKIDYIEILSTEPALYKEA